MDLKIIIIIIVLYFIFFKKEGFSNQDKVTWGQCWTDTKFGIDLMKVNNKSPKWLQIVKNNSINNDGSSKKSTISAKQCDSFKKLWFKKLQEIQRDTMKTFGDYHKQYTCLPKDQKNNFEIWNDVFEIGSGTAKKEYDLKSLKKGFQEIKDLKFIAKGNKAIMDLLKSTFPKGSMKAKKSEHIQYLCKELNVSNDTNTNVF